MRGVLFATLLSATCVGAVMCGRGPTEAMADRAIDYPTSPAASTTLPVGPETALAVQLWDGQSLACGGQAVDASNFPICDALQLGDSTGKYDLADTGAPSLYPAAAIWARPAVDAATAIASGQTPYANNILGNSPDIRSVAVAQQLFLTENLPTYRWARSNVAVGNTNADGLIPGGTTNSFDAAVFEANAWVKNPHLDASSSYGGRYAGGGLPVFYHSIVILHGEADCDSSLWGQKMITLVSALQTKFKAATGQTRQVPALVASQTSRCNDFFLDDYTIPQAWSLYEASVAAGSHCATAADATANNAVCVSTFASYWWQYGPDQTHHTSYGYQQVGAYAGAWTRDIEKWQLGTGPWPEPVAPISATLDVTNTILTITVGNLRGHLVTDDSHGKPHQSGAFSMWSLGEGIEGWGRSVDAASGNPLGDYQNDGGSQFGADALPIAITSFAIVGTNQIVVQFAAPITRWAYAASPDVFPASNPATGTAGVATGRVGNIRDSGDGTFDPFSGTAVERWMIPTAYLCARAGGSCTASWQGRGDADAAMP